VAITTCVNRPSAQARSRCASRLRPFRVEMLQGLVQQQEAAAAEVAAQVRVQQRQERRPLAGAQQLAG